MGLCSMGCICDTIGIVRCTTSLDNPFMPIYFQAKQSLNCVSKSSSSFSYFGFKALAMCIGFNFSPFATNCALFISARASKDTLCCPILLPSIGLFKDYISLSYIKFQKKSWESASPFLIVPSPFLFGSSHRASHLS